MARQKRTPPPVPGENGASSKKKPCGNSTCGSGLAAQRPAWEELKSLGLIPLDEQYDCMKAVGSFYTNKLKSLNPKPTGSVIELQPLTAQAKAQTHPVQDFGVCWKCFAVTRLPAAKCQECGHLFQPEGRELQHIKKSQQQKPPGKGKHQQHAAGGADPHKAHPPEPGSEPKGKQPAITAQQKIEELEQLAAKLQADRIEFARRLPVLRHKAGDLGLTMRDPELIGLLTAARRRRLGSDGLLRPGDRLDLTPQPWICDGLFLKGCLNLLVALPKQGKTSLVVAMIAAWHHGAGAFLDRPLVGPCPPVLVIGTDQGQADWGRLLLPAGLMQEVEGEGVILPPIVGLAHSGRPVHLNPEGIDLIAEQAQQTPGLLVVIDSLAACIAPLGLKEESPEVAMPVAELMEQLEPHGATVILIHHASKGRAGEGAASASRGSTALPAIASQILKLGAASAGNPQDRRRVLTTEGRGGSPLALVIEREGSSWIVHGGMEMLEHEQDQAEMLRKLTDPQAECLDVVTERWADGLQRTTAADVVAALGMKGQDPHTTAWRRLKQLERKGLLQSIKQPDQFGARGAFAYWPTADSQPTPSRGDQKNSVGSVGSVGSQPLAHEDPDRFASVFSSGDPTADTADTTDTKNATPTRGVGSVSEAKTEPTHRTGRPIRVDGQPGWTLPGALLPKGPTSG
jgi:hypothetical protein